MRHATIDQSGAGRGTFTSYVTGFILSVVLTGLAFWLVMNGSLSKMSLLIAIFAAAIAQILVHLHYFLHLGSSSTARWNILSLIFTVLIMILFVGGSLWIMYSLNYRMM